MSQGVRVPGHARLQSMLGVGQNWQQHRACWEWDGTGSSTERLCAEHAGSEQWHQLTKPPSPLSQCGPREACRALGTQTGHEHYDMVLLTLMNLGVSPSRALLQIIYGSLSFDDLPPNLSIKR